MSDRETDKAMWERLEQHGADITEITKNQIHTETRLSSLESAVDNGFRNISSELGAISDRINQPPAPPNYIGWFGIAFGILTVFGGYSALITRPMEHSLSRHEAQINETDETAIKAATNEARLNDLMKKIEIMDRYGVRGDGG